MNGKDRWLWLVLVVAGWLWAPIGAFPCGTGQSCLPDTDQTGFNNTFAVAVDLGVLVDAQSGQPRVVARDAELGQVATGFDSADFFKFRMPPNDFEITISTSEDPEFTSYIEIYDENQKPLIRPEEGRGHPHESVTLNLGAGLYYVAVKTTADTARGRLLKYSLKVEPRVRPLPDQAGSNCSSSPSLGEVTTGRSISGSLGGTGLRDTYSVYMTRGAQFVAVPVVYPRVYDVWMIDRPTGDRILVAQRGRSDPRYIALDPGFYCLEIAADYQPGPVNYRFNVGVSNLGFPPARERANAPCVTMLNLGNLSRNGSYGQVRQPQAYVPTTPCHFEGVTQYVMREWVGRQQPEAWLRFELRETRKLELKMSNLYNPVRAEVHDAQGNVMGTTVSQGVSLTDQLPPQVFMRTLAAGLYYLRVIYTGTRDPGTSFQVWMVANPP